MLNLRILTPDTVLFDGPVERVSVPGLPGRLTILPRHVPVTSALLPGEIIVHTSSDQQSFTMHSGFLHVENNTAVVLVSQAMNTDQLDESAVLAAKARAEALLAEKPVGQEFVVARNLLRNSLSDLKILRRRRRTSP